MPPDFENNLDPDQNLLSEYESVANKSKNVQVNHNLENRENNRSCMASQLSNPPAYYSNIPDEVHEVDASNYISDAGSQRYFGMNLKNKNPRKILKDPKGYVLVRGRESEALRDVIHSQKLKIDQQQEAEDFLRREIKALESHISTL